MADQSIKDIWFSAIGRASNYQTMVYYAGTGQDTFEFNFSGGYINKEDIKAFMVDDVTRERVDLTLTFTNTNTVKTNSVVPVGWTICIYRDTPKSMPLAKFVDGAIINATNLDRNAKQAVFSVSEMVDRFDSTVEQVDSALVQVAAALKAAEEAVETANLADAKADTAISTANGAVTTANAASSKADTAINTANAATTTAEGAVKTANEAKETADGLNAQIIQANETAYNALTTANGIDAKATKALSDAAAAVKTANEAKTTANAIDAKATQAQKDAAAALEATDVAKQLSDRVKYYPNATNIAWKGMHVFKSVRIEPNAETDIAHFTTISNFKYQDGTRTAMYLATPETPGPGYFLDYLNTPTEYKARFNCDVDVNRKLIVAGDVTHRTSTLVNTLTANGAVNFKYTLTTADEIKTTGSSIKFDLNGRRHLWWNAGGGKADFVMYKDPNEAIVWAHQGTGGSASLDFTPVGNLNFGSTSGGNIGGIANLEFTARNGARYDHWIRQSGDATGTNWVFGIGGSEQVNLQYRESGGNIAIFNNEVYANGPVRGSELRCAGEVWAGNGNGKLNGDGNLQGGIWTSMGYNYASVAVADALDRGAVALREIRRGGQQYYYTESMSDEWESPAGCVLTGRNNRVNDGRRMGFYFRRMQAYSINRGWYEIGD